MRQMVAHERPGNAAKRFVHRRNLHQNVRAISVFCHHALNPANLAFDAIQSPQIGSFDFVIHPEGFAFR
jgi:hypothetical protein